MTQCWLLSKAQDAEAVRGEFQNLAGLAREMVQPDRRDGLEKFIDGMAEEWRQAIASPWRGEEIDAAERELGARWDAADNHEALRDDVCATLLTTVDSIHGRLRKRIRDEMDATSLLASELGERIDQGLRPDRVHRHMLRLPDLESVEGWDWTVEVEAGAAEERRVANRRVLPGEIRPEEGWPGKVKQLWGELGVPSVLPPGLEALSTGRVVEGNLVELVREVSQAARRELVRLRDRASAPRWDRAEEPHRLFWRGQVIRTVRVLPDSRIIPILNAFQAAGWPRAIENPLGDPQRLHQTLRTLNDGLTGISFHAEGGGKRVTWRVSDGDGSSQPTHGT